MSRNGIDSITSMTRAMRLSTNPPAYPAARPNTVPRATLIAVASTPTTRETLAP